MDFAAGECFSQGMPTLSRVDIHAFVFDMDGVLVDSEPLHMRSANRLLERFDREIDEPTYRSFIGSGEVATWTEWKQTFALPLSVSEIIAEHTRLRTEEIRRGVAPIPSAVSLARRLHGRGHRLGLASSSAREVIDEMLIALGLDDVFRVRVSGADPDVRHSKPAPDVYLHAAARLGVQPTHCLAIEDSEPGVRAAKSAGMVCIAIPNRWTDHQDFSAADTVAADLAEMDWSWADGSDPL